MIAALERAVRKAGGQSKLGRLIGTSQQQVWRFLNLTGGKVPAELVLRIEKATGVPRHALRPDIYPKPRRRRARKAP